MLFEDGQFRLVGAGRRVSHLATGDMRPMRGMKPQPHSFREATRPFTLNVTMPVFGIALLFIPAILIVVMPGTISGYAMAGMVVGIVLLIAGFVSLPGSLQNILANKLRPKP